jgi:hypothetical protein
MLTLNVNLDTIRPAQIELMTNEGADFTFTSPSGWTEFRDGSRVVFHGRNQEELIVSGTQIAGRGDSAERLRIQQTAFKGAMQVVERSAAHPDLKVIQPLARDTRVAGLECWTILAQTSQGDTVFYQSVIGHMRGVLLITFEAPRSAESDRVYREFLRSIEFVTNSEDLASRSIEALLHDKRPRTPN